MTNEDTSLLKCLPDKQQRLRELIDVGKPYVWELRLSQEEFYELETTIGNSISSHTGDYHHLLCEDFAVIIVMYLAEWYKRFYKGADTMDENKVLSLTTEELKKVYQLAKIDHNVFVYNASKNPDKTSYRWLESLHVLGGLAVQAELKRDENDDKLLSQLCKIFHDEEIDLDDLKDRNRAVAFQESIARQHSLYDYLDCILDKEKEMPFAKSDMRDENTCIPEFLKRILEADREAKKNKFDFEWLIAYTASRQQMVRHLRVKMKPEVIGGGKKQYIGYDRLMLPEWGIDHPEEIGRIRFYLRFKNGGHYIKKEGKTDEPLFKYDNDIYTQSFLSVNKVDESVYNDVPVSRFDKVEMVMKYDLPQSDGSIKTIGKVVQELEVFDYMQVYALPKTSNKFSNRRNSQAATAVIFSSAYHLTEPYHDLPVVYAHYRNGEDCSEDYCWCPINDKVIIADANGKEVMPPFFNRNGLYQVVTKKYLKTIKYRDNVFVLYKYIDTDLDDDEYEHKEVPVLFGRSGLEVRHYATGQTKEATPITDYDLEWLNGGRYVDWSKEEPEQGFLRLRVTVKGIVFKPQVYYVPFEPQNIEQEPIWRDFERMRICTALDGVEDIQDEFSKTLDIKEPDTKQEESKPLDPWGQLLNTLGFNGLGNVGKHLGITLATLPGMIFGVFTGKTKSLGMNSETLIPLASLAAGHFIKNPVLKAALMGYGGLNLLNKVGNEAIAMRTGENKSTTNVTYKQYADETLNPRIANLHIEGNQLLADIDRVPCTIALPDTAVKAYQSGALPLNTLANAVLAKSDLMAQQAQQASQAYNNMQRQEQSRGIR